MIERKALIFNIQKYNMYDGPGVRTLIFFKGCPLRCKWCSNPEGQLRPFQVLYKRDLCIHCGQCVPVCPVGIHKIAPGSRLHEMDRNVECIGCRKCEEACTATALKVVGEQKTISELLDIIEEDRPFYETSGGGITLGGGECLMQPEAALNLLVACKQRGIHTAIETCGYARPEVLEKFAAFTDLFLFDVKHMDSDAHYAMTGVRNESILTNVQWLFENRYNVKIRVPLVKGFNDSEENFRQLLQFLQPYRDYKNFKGLDILPYHKMGVNKYSQLSWTYEMEDASSLSDADLERVEGYCTQSGLQVAVIRH